MCVSYGHQIVMSCIFINNSIYGLGRRKGLVCLTDRSLFPCYYNKKLQTLNGECMHGSGGLNNNRFKKERTCLGINRTWIATWMIQSMKQKTNIPKIMFPAILVCLCLSHIIIISFITLMFLLDSLISFTLDMLEFNRSICTAP